jgi:hypothetical protein
VLALSHSPLVLQVRAPLPEHSAALGAQTPMHAPFAHAWLVQGIGVLQVPVGLHVCTASPEHWLVPGAHSPVHTPPAHA